MCQKFVLWVGGLHSAMPETGMYACVSVCVWTAYIVLCLKPVCMRVCRYVCYAWNRYRYTYIHTYIHTHTHTHTHTRTHTHTHTHRQSRTRFLTFWKNSFSRKDLPRFFILFFILFSILSLKDSNRVRVANMLPVCCQCVANVLQRFSSSLSRKDLSRCFFLFKWSFFYFSKM